MLEENKQLVRKLYEECWNKGKLDVIGQIVSSDCRLHDPVFPSLGAGVEGLRKHIQMNRAAFPDLHFKIDDMIAERDEVVVHWTGRGTQEGPFLGLAPTKRTGSVSGTSICRIKNGKIVEGWTDWNVTTLLEQLGIAVSPKLSLAAR